MALFLKYRPQTFDDLIGQESVVKTLKNALKLQKSAHAYLFSGSRGTGKTSTARIFAKALICPHIRDGNPCGKCDFCTKISEGSLIDVVEIDAASNRGIDEIRDLREKIKFAPTFADKKIYIIDEVHMLTVHAFNALLKTLEEPPEHAFFLLATTERHKLPATIISRCQSFIFSRFRVEEIIQQLRMICENENISFEIPALELIARKADGGMRDAISLLDQLSSETERHITEISVMNSLGMVQSELLSRCWIALKNKNLEEAFQILSSIRTAGGDFKIFGHDFLLYLREEMHKNISSEELSLYISAIDEIQTALIRLKSSPFSDLPFEIAFVRIVSAFGSFYPSNESISQKMAPPEKPKASSLDRETPETEKRVSDTTGFVFDVPVKIERTQNIAPPSGENIDSLSSHDLALRLKEISEKAGLSPSLKRPFLSCTPVIVEDHITFQTETFFYYQQLTTSSDLKVKLQNVISSLFKKTYFVDFSCSSVEGKGDFNKIATQDDIFRTFLS